MKADNYYDSFLCRDEFTYAKNTMKYLYLLLIILLTGCYSDRTSSAIQRDDGLFIKRTPENLPSPVSTVNGKSIYKCEIDGVECLYWYNISYGGYYELVMTKK